MHGRARAGGWASAVRRVAARAPGLTGRTGAARRWISGVTSSPSKVWRAHSSRQPPIFFPHTMGGGAKQDFVRPDMASIKARNLLDRVMETKRASAGARPMRTPTGLFTETASGARIVHLTGTDASESPRGVLDAATVRNLIAKLLEVREPRAMQSDAPCIPGSL